MRHQHAFRAILGTTGVALVAAACSSSPATTGTSTTTTAPSAGQNVATDKALAQAANLRLTDFPTGWTSAPQSSDSESNALIAQVKRCLHTNLVLLQQNGPTLVESPEFSDSSGDDIDSNVAYLASASKADAEMRVIKQANFPTCLTSAANTVFQNLINHPPASGSTLPQGASIGHIAVEPMSFPTFGDQSAAFRTAIPFNYHGLTLTFDFDVVAFIKGRAVAGMDFGGGEMPITSSMEEQLTNIVLGRLSNT